MLGGLFSTVNVFLELALYRLNLHGITIITCSSRLDFKYLHEAVLNKYCYGSK